MLKTVLPKNHTDLEKALDITIAARFDYGLPIGSYWSAQHCPDEFLPCLAWALSVDVWNDNWSAKVKRQVIAASVSIHKTKGTAAAMRKALDALDLGLQIDEWFKTGGDPFTFEASVSISNQSLNRRDITDIIEIIQQTKNARSHLTALKLYLVTKSESFGGAALLTGQGAMILPYQPKLPVKNFLQPIGSAFISYQKTTIGAA